MNVVMTGAGRFIEVQGTAEGLPFTRAELDELLGARRGTGSASSSTSSGSCSPNRPRRAVRDDASCSPPRIPTRPPRSERSSLLPRLRWISVSVTRRSPTSRRPAQRSRRTPASRPTRSASRPADRRSPTTRGSRSTRSAELRESGPRGSPARTRRTPTTARSCSDAWTECREREGPLGSRPSRSHAGRTVVRSQRSGAVEGTIIEHARGDRGFGYDPLFVPDDGDGRTFAEMTAEEKHAISHRARAFRTLADGLRVLAEVGDC